VVFGTPSCGTNACTDLDYSTSTGKTNDATIVVASSGYDSGEFLPLIAHEVGHTYGADDCSSYAGGCTISTTIMFNGGLNDNYPTSPLCCDQMLLYDMTSAWYGIYGTQSCGSGGSCSASWCVGSTDLNCSDGACGFGCCPTGGGGGGCDGGCIAGGDPCDDGCGDPCCSGTCGGDLCGNTDPIVIDLTGRGYQLTNQANGVKFDFSGTGPPIQMSWTAGGWDGGFLALDRNGNGRSDNATELFSNITPQPTIPGKTANGFLALAVYDQPANGGNGDGWIDEQDAIYSKLLIWVDRNHNGVSDPGELLTLKQAGIDAISLNYSSNQWTDAFGNTFRYSSQMHTNTSVNQLVYDVLLQAGGKATPTTAATKQ
jgi:hypothetical protein